MNTIKNISVRVVLLGCLVALFPVVARAELQMPPFLVTGHGGVSVPYMNDQWNMKVTEEATGNHTADEALFYLNENTMVNTDDISSSSYGWLGTTAGQTIYVVPQIRRADTAFFGFNDAGMTETDTAKLAAWEPDDSRVALLHHDEEESDVDFDEEAEAWIRIDLLSVQGLNGTAAPGQFSLWTADDENGIIVWMSTAQTPAEGNSFYLDVEHGHSHVAWGFTESGLYEVTFQASTYLTGDPEMVLTTSPATTYYFGVLNAAPEPGSLALLCSAAVASLLSLSRRCRNG